MCAKLRAVEVLKGIDLDVRSGEFIALVGPSGCGKSTLLAIIAGLEKASSGEISIGDRVVNYVAPKDRDIAMVFQSYALYPTMTVRQNMMFGMEAAACQRIEREAALKRVSALLQIDQLMHTEARPTLRRPAPARRHGAGAGARSRRCSCSTSRCPTSTPNCASRCAARSRSCTRGSARPRSM